MKNALDMLSCNNVIIPSLSDKSPQILWFQGNLYAKLFDILMRERGFDIQLVIQADDAITCFKNNSYDAVVFAHFFTKEYDGACKTSVEMRKWERKVNKKHRTPFFAFPTFAGKPIHQNLAKCGIDYACSMTELDLLIALIRSQMNLTEFSVRSENF